MLPSPATLFPRFFPPFVIVNFLLNFMNFKIISESVPSHAVERVDSGQRFSVNIILRDTSEIRRPAVQGVVPVVPQYEELAIGDKEGKINITLAESMFRYIRILFKKLIIYLDEAFFINFNLIATLSNNTPQEEFIIEVESTDITNFGFLVSHKQNNIPGLKAGFHVMSVSDFDYRKNNKRYNNRNGCHDHEGPESSLQGLPESSFAPDLAHFGFDFIQIRQRLVVLWFLRHG